MAERDLVQLDVRLEPDTYQQFRDLVGGRGMSPTARKLIEDYVATAPVRAAIDAIREGQRGP